MLQALTAWETFASQIFHSENRSVLLLVGGELDNSAVDLASFRGYRILHGTSLLGGRTRVTALAVGVLRPAPVS